MSCGFLERAAKACYFELLARSGGTGRRAGLKIQWYLVPCGFDPLLRDHLLIPQANVEIPVQVPHARGSQKKNVFQAFKRFNISSARRLRRIVAVASAKQFDLEGASCHACVACTSLL